MSTRSVLVALALLLLACGDPLPTRPARDAAPPEDAAEDEGLDAARDPRDLDSDRDSIADLHERGLDSDRDGADDEQDTDSDGDGIRDAREAGDDDPRTFPVDTDSDGVPDFRDLDSDGDGLADGAELGAGTSRTEIDSDRDGVDDLVETTYGSDPLDERDSPRARGDFVFAVPYRAAPAPARDTLSFSTALREVDVYVAIDTSGSMQGEIANLTAGFRATIVPEVLRRIPGARFGVGRFEDCPSGACRGAMANLQDITGDPALVEAALRSITTTCGGTEPYRQMLWLLASGDTSAFSGSVTPRRCADPGAIGWPCFRPEAVRVIVQVGDEPMAESGWCAPGRTHAEAIEALAAESIRYIGITSEAGTRLREDMEAIGRGTGSVGAASGLPFVYSIDGSGSGLSTTLVDALAELAGSLPVRVDAIPRDEPGDSVDAIASFVERIETNTGGAVVLGRACTAGLESGGDHFPRVLPGTGVCFDIVLRENDSVPATSEPQIFRAAIDVVGDRSTPLDARDVYFVVPPAIPEPGGPH